VFDWLLQEEWLAWGVGLLIGFPLLTILFGEMLYRIERVDDSSRSSSLGNTLYFVLPSLVVWLLLTNVLELDESNVWVRVSASLFWISLIYLSLSIFNLFWSAKRRGREGWQSRVPSLVLNIARLFFILLGTAFVMSSVWGIDLGRMLAALGVGSIVLGLALQDTLGGLFAGITLISARQFKVGDWLKTGEVTGQVVTVNWYSVTLKTFENDLLIIPNSVLARDTFRNYSQPSPIHMERIVVQFWEEHPPNLVRKALLEAAHASPGVLDEPAPQVLLNELADDAGAYEAQLFFGDYAIIDEIRDAFLTNAWYAAKRYNIVFPYADYQLYHFAGSEMNLGDDDTVEPEDLIGKLIELDVFDLSREDLDTITTNAIIQRFGAAEQIVKSGVEFRTIFVVLTGSARRYVIDNDGRERNMGSAEPGDLFGLVAALRHSKNMISVYADSDVQIAKLSLESVERVLKSNPQFAQDLEEYIEARLESVDSILQHSEESKLRNDGGDGSAVPAVNLTRLLSRKGKRRARPK